MQFGVKLIFSTGEGSDHAEGEASSARKSAAVLLFDGMSRARQNGRRFCLSMYESFLSATSLLLCLFGR